MNNPFLSDRNIFSKVSNPVRKKRQEQNKDQTQIKKTQFKSSDVNKDATAAPYKSPQNNLQQSNGVSAPRTLLPANKITFGEPQAQPLRTTFDKTLLNNPREQMYEPTMSYKNEDRKQLQDSTRTYKLSNQNNKYPLDNYKSIPSSEANQPYKFEQFRKQNNLNDCSPINSSPNHINSSEFLNIDAIGEDLNRFLAQSRNQEELCKLLGIERNNPNSNRLPQNPVQPFKHEDPQQKYVSNLTNQPRKQPMVTESMIQYVPAQPNAFAKKFMDPPEVLGVLRPELTMVQSEKQIPTFNYKQIDHEEQQSQQEYKIPSFAPVQNKANKRAFSKATPSVLRDNLEVFNYSQGHNPKQYNNIEQVIQKQMMQLSIKGKYRTFLTSSQKIVTVKYKLQAL